MIVSITGHTKGLGDSIFKLLSTKHQTIGLSKSNGYDIKDVSNIIDIIKDTDVFINNAYFKSYQSEIFENLFELWKDSNKLIININSSIVTEKEIADDLIEYHSYKTQFKENVSNIISKYDNKRVRVMNIYPSTLSTNYFYSNINKIDNNYIASLIDWAINQRNDIELRDITIYPSKIKSDIKNNFII